MKDRKSREQSVDQLRREILDKVAEYHALAHAPSQRFVPGESSIRYGGRVYDEREMVNLVEAALEFWLTAGRHADEFERVFAGLLGVEHCCLTNSGSSANLLAFSALTSPLLEQRRVMPGDEVITVAAGFPTTVAPILQSQAVPVFVDVTVDDGTYNVDVGQLEQALSPRTRAVMLAHTLGNPFDVDAVTAFCRRHGLWLIEDCCDALGSTYRGRLTGTFGDISTFSFYPAHHITMGEGGAVCTNSATLKRIVESYRDWGRDCCCKPGTDNTCRKRFNQQFGTLPSGYDHKYIYSHLGYNLKITDLQAAIGVAQLEKLASFGATRRRNWAVLSDGLADLEQQFILPHPTRHADPSWFGFVLTVRDESGLARDHIVGQLEKQKIQTRLLFAGNLLRHPCFDELRRAGTGYRVVGDLARTDRLTRHSFWLGVYPGMTPPMLDFVISRLHRVTESASGGRRTGASGP